MKSMSMYAAERAEQAKEARVRANAVAIYAAASELLADVRRRYPGEELKCPYMRALDAAVAKATV